MHAEVQVWRQRIAMKSVLSFFHMGSQSSLFSQVLYSLSHLGGQRDIFARISQRVESSAYCILPCCAVAGRRDVEVSEGQRVRKQTLVCTVETTSAVEIFNEESWTVLTLQESAGRMHSDRGFFEMI